MLIVVLHHLLIIGRVDVADFAKSVTGASQGCMMSPTDVARERRYAECRMARG
jgi:hypothetical protein